MANAFYVAGKEGFLGSTLDWDTDGFRTSLHTSAYTVALTTHDFFDDVTNEVVDDDANIGTPTVGSVADAVIDGDDITWTGADNGTGAYIVIRQYNVTDSAAKLVIYIDSATNLPVVTNGGDVTVAWAAGGIATWNG